MLHRHDPKLNDEPARLRAVHRADLLYLPEEPEFSSITNLVRQVIGTPICAVSLIDRDRQWFKSIRGLDARESPRDIAFCDHTIRRREVMMVEDARQDLRFAANPLVTGEPFLRAYCGAPLCSADGYNLGSLCVLDTRPRDFSAQDCQVLERFAGVVVEQMELRSLAQRDSLTGAMTRRAFDEALEAAVMRHSRDASPATLVMFDVDHFKHVNDRFGHGVGDEVLKQLAQTTGGQLRLGDQFGRLGGEEFAILLNGVDENQSLFAAERLRRGIAAMTPAACGGITISCGIAALSPEYSPERWLAQADAALYAAKRSGRNRCVGAGELLSSIDKAA